MQTPKQEFISTLFDSLQAGKFVKLTLSKPGSKDEKIPQNIYGRLVELKKGTALSCTLRYPTKDITKNYLIDTELQAQLETWLGSHFLIATLLTSEEDITLRHNKKRKAKLLRKRTEQRQAAAPQSHNKQKDYHISYKAAFLHQLGVTSQNGKIFSDYRDKFRQINKYVEIVESLLEQAGLLKKEHLNIVDMGSGKGYLTFALYNWLKEQGQLAVNILGVELREQLTQFCNEKSRELGWDDELRFQALDIMDYNEGNLDVLIALHACDVATDIAIAQGIKNEASLIVTAPCCHKQVRKAMRAEGALQQITRHGILFERQAELLTDTIRAMLLERAGYQTKVFEFISSEHTAKNVMIAGIKTRKLNEEALQRINKDIAELKATWGIEEHYLETLLQG